MQDNSNNRLFSIAIGVFFPNLSGQKCFDLLASSKRKVRYSFESSSDKYFSGTSKLFL